MIKIRLHGLPEEIEQAKTALSETFNVLTASEPYADRGNSKYMRCYMDCELKKAASTSDCANTTDKPKLLEKTTEELIYALEHCVLGTNECEGCPYQADNLDCPQGLHGDVILKLKQLQEERDVFLRQVRILDLVNFLACKNTDCTNCRYRSLCEETRGPRFFDDKNIECASLLEAIVSVFLQEAGIIKKLTKEEKIKGFSILNEIYPLTKESKNESDK